MNESKGPIFIGGTGRCGTTVLVRVLSRHPSIFTLRWESQLLVAPMGLLHLAEIGFRPKALAAFESRLRGRWFHRILNRGTAQEYPAGLSHDITFSEVESSLSALRRLVARPPEGCEPLDIAAHFTEHLFAPPTGRAGALRWCEKTPRNVLFVDRLARMFPAMRFIHILRDGRDVVASMVARGFWPIASGHEFKSLARFRGTVKADLAARYWVEVLRLARQIASGDGVGPHNYIEVRLEDLVRDPEAVLGTLCEFLGEELEPTMLKHDLSKHHAGRWKEDLRPKEVEAVERIACEALCREGYA